MTCSTQKILFILHLPSPVHGSSMVGAYIKNSDQINSAFNSHYINLGTSASIDEIGKGGIRKIFRYVKIIKKVMSQLITFKPDLCYLAISAKGGAFYKDALIALIIKSLGFKIVYHFHNKGVKINQEKKLDNFLYSLVFKNSDVILLSKHLYQDVEKYIPNERVYYCPNGIPDSIQNSKFKILNKVKTVELLFLSNLIESKGVFILLDALALLNERNIDFHCTYVGGEGDVTKEQFNAKVTNLMLEGKVQYVGKKYGSHKEKIFSTADIFVLPTYNECFPLVLLEAMQFSLPVISTPEGGIPDIIEDGENGFLVPKENVQVLSEKIEVLIKDPELRKEMGEKGRKKYEEEFTLDIFETRLTNILSEIIVKNKQKAF